MSQAILETPLVRGLSLLPCVCSKPIEPVVLVVSLVGISVGESFLSLTMFKRIDQHSLVGELASLQSSLSMHDTKFPLSLVGSTPFFDIETFIVSKSIREVSRKSPFKVNNLDASITLEIIGKGPLEPSHSSLQVNSSSLPSVPLHHSLVDVPIFEDEHRPPLAPSLFEFSNVHLVRTQPHYLQLFRMLFHLLNEFMVQGMIPD